MGRNCGDPLHLEPIRPPTYIVHSALEDSEGETHDRELGGSRESEGEYPGIFGVAEIRVLHNFRSAFLRLCLALYW